MRVKEKVKSVNNMCIFFSNVILPVAVTATEIQCDLQLEKENDLIFMSGRRGSWYNPPVMMALITLKMQRGEQQDSGSLLCTHLPLTGSLLSGTHTALSLGTLPPLRANLDLSYSH